MEVERESIVFYRSFYEAIQSIEDPRERAAAYDAIIAYGLNGEEPGVDGIANALFIMAKPLMDKNQANYENAKKGGRKPKANRTETEPKPNQNRIETETEPKANRTETEPLPNVNVNVNVNDNVNENDNANVNEEHKGRTSAPRFRKPTREEVRAYCQERGNHVDVDRWFDYYESNGWKVGKNPMKDWKAAVRTWEKNGFDNPRGKPNTYGGSTERANAFDELEEQLMNELNGGL